MIPLLLLQACTGSADSVTPKDTSTPDDTGDTADTADTADTTDTTDTSALSTVSGSFKERCGLDLESQAGPTDGDLTGSLVVVENGVELGPWAGFGVTLAAGDYYGVILYACMPAESGAQFGDLDVSFGASLFLDSDPTSLPIVGTPGSDASALGHLTDTAGLTSGGPGTYMFTSGTASIDPGIFDGGVFQGTFSVQADIAVEITVDVSW